MLQKLAQWNSMRNQMLSGFLFVMMIVLLCAGYMTFHSVSGLLKDKAETQMKQTALQAGGRLEAQIRQIDTLTLQAVNDVYLQQLLLSIAQGQSEAFTQRQSLLQLVNEMQAYSSGITAVEVYTADHRRLFPLDGQPLTESIDRAWVDKADAGKGRLVWIGVDPGDRESVLAIRRINLVDQWFSGGGYVLLRLDRSFFQFQASPEAEPVTPAERQERILLLDAAARPIVADDNLLAGAEELLRNPSQTADVDGRRYMLVKHPYEQTGWTLLMLYPESAITEGISVLRDALVVSGVVGGMLFISLSLLLSTMITRPILRLMRAMRNTRQGILTHNPDVSYTLELNDLNTTYNQMVDHMNGLIKLVYEKEMIQSRTQLQALQAQINPHFLYNTLEALYWSLQEKDEEELAELVIAMSEIFRYVISGSETGEWVTVGQELEHVERYLRIMNVRFGSRLSWELRVEERHRAVRIPKLLIQPLVENAILHGVEGKLGPGLVSVSVETAQEHPDSLLVSVSDDGPGMNTGELQKLREHLGRKRTSHREKGKGLGMGMSNVQSRLELYYSEPEDSSRPRGLSVESRCGCGTTVFFYIPVHKEELPDAAGETYSHCG